MFKRWTFEKFCITCDFSNLGTSTIAGTLSPTMLNHSGNHQSSGDKQNVSASTPVKNDRSAGQIDMSSNNISPIQDYRTATTGRRVVTYDRPSPDGQHRLSQPRSPDGRFSIPRSPDGKRNSQQHQQQQLSPRLPDGQHPRSPQWPASADRGPAATPFVRPASGRSAMDLYAAIHESKKRLLGQQPAAVAGPVTGAVAQPIPRSQPTVGAAAAVRRSTERQSDRYRPRDDRSARFDFKRLLLQTNMAGGRRTQQSAVVRLQQPQPPARTVAPTFRGGGPMVAAKRAPSSSSSSSWRSNVLASTIQEDCREDEDQSAAYGCDTAAVVPKSATLVNRTHKDLQSVTYSTLETAL